MPIKSRLTTLLLITAQILLFTNRGQGQEIRIETSDLMDSLKVFDEGSRVFRKFEAGDKSRSVSWYLRTPEEKGSWLEIDPPQGTDLLINDQYVGKLFRGKRIDLDSLEGSSLVNNFEFTLFRASGISFSALSIELNRPVAVVEGTPLNRVADNEFLDFYVLAGIILLLFIGALSKRFPRDTMDYFSFFRSLSFKNKEETLISTRPFNRTNILFIALDSLLIGFLLLALAKLTYGVVHVPFVNEEMTFWELIFTWVIFGILVFISLILKYITTNLFTGLFKLGEFVYIQHFNSLRFSLGAFLLIFLGVSSTFLAYRTEGLGAYVVFINVAVILLIIRIVVLFFKLRDFTSYRNFHLFSYLCSTEIIPFVILYKLVLG